MGPAHPSPAASEAISMLAEEPDDVPFDHPRGNLTADSLFGDIQLPADAAGKNRIPSSPSMNVGAMSIEAGQLAFGQERWADAREHFAAALRANPRNRSIRALYHVASGMELRARGEGAKATLQFETALAHDRECEEARRALGQAGDDKKGLFKRFFDR
jgi:hypothetical protein